MEFKKVVLRLSFLLPLTLLLGCGKGSGPGGDGIKVIYVLNNIIPNFGGVAGADALCNANRPADVTSAKAMIVDGSTRIACTTANCTGGISENVDWALAPSTTYYRAEDHSVVIGTTNSAAIFDTDLNNSMLSGGGREVWTGLYDDWTVTTGNLCLNWTSNNGANWGTVGLTNQTTRSIPNSYLDAYFQFCDRTNVSLYCVEQ